MSVKRRLSRRALTNVLLGLTVVLVALYQPLFGTRPRGSAEALTQWAAWFAVYVGVIIALALTTAVLALREARSLMEKGHDERTKLLAELLLSLPENRGDRNDPAPRA